MFTDGHMTCAAVNNMCTEEVIEDDDCVATLPHSKVSKYLLVSV